MHFARNIRICMAATAILLLAVLVSCGTVDYGYVDTGESDHNNPSISEIGFSVDWSKMEDYEMPSEFKVVLSRIVNTVHYVYSLDQDGGILNSLEIIPAVPDSTATSDSSQTAEPQVPDEPAEDMTLASLAADLGETDLPKAVTDTILNGDYYVLAIAQTGDKYKYILEGVEQFQDSLNISMKDLYATIPQVPDEEILEAEIVDFNPMYPFIYSAEPLFLEVKKQSLYPKEEVNRLTIAPQHITRNIAFRLNVELEHGVKIERLLGIISGVPSKMQLMSGVVDRYDTGKVFFELKDDFSLGNEFIYMGDVNVLGLFPATKPGFITGPGILQLILDASVDGSGKRRFFASINLKETIEKADIMIETDDHEGYRCTRDAVLEIPTKLIVNRDHILSSGGNGLEIWFDNEKHVDAEI